MDLAWGSTAPLLPLEEWALNQGPLYDNEGHWEDGCKGQFSTQYEVLVHSTESVHSPFYTECCPRVEWSGMYPSKPHLCRVYTFVFACSRYIVTHTHNDIIGQSITKYFFFLVNAETITNSYTCTVQ